MINKYINNIHQGDCLELFKEMPDSSVDMTFADPPFNLKKSYRGNFFAQYPKMVNVLCNLFE